MEIKTLTLDRKKLDAMPEDERALFLLASHALNEMNIFVKIFHWSVEGDDASAIVKKGADTIFLTIIKTLCAKMYEVWNMLKINYFNTKLKVSLEHLLSEKSKEALKYLGKSFAAQSPVAVVRNKSAFHYDSDQVIKSYELIGNDKELDIYIADGLNHLCWFAEIFVNASLLREIGGDDYQNGFNILQEDSTRVHRHLTALLFDLTEIFVLKYFGESLEELGMQSMEISAPRSDSVHIPFFVELVGADAASASDEGGDS